MISDTVLVALIGGGALLLSTAVNAGLFRRQGHRLRRVETNTEAVREQVQNGHVKPDGTPINLREEADERHEENATKLDAAIELLESLQRKVVRLFDITAGHGSRLNEIDEMTQPRSAFAPPAKHRRRDT